LSSMQHAASYCKYRGSSVCMTGSFGHATGPTRRPSPSALASGKSPGCSGQSVHGAHSDDWCACVDPTAIALR